MTPNVAEVFAYRDTYTHDPVWKLALCHAERLDALEAENERLRGPGSPHARLAYLLEELARLFPDEHSLFASSPSEPKYIAAIERLRADLEERCTSIDRLDAECIRLRAELATARKALYHIAITDDVDCAYTNDAKALTRIAREALREGGGNG